MEGSSIPRIAFLGVGWMGQMAHLANYARLQDEGACTIAGVTDLRSDLATAVTERYRLPRVFGSAEELLADPAVDAVVCVQQWPNNFPLVTNILDAGKSAFTEKPMTGRLDEAKDLAERAAAAGVQYAVGFMKRYDGGVDLAKDLITKVAAHGSLGELRSVDAVCDGGDWIQNAGQPVQTDLARPLATPRYPDACTDTARQAAYEYLINIFSHTVNLCHYLLDTDLEPRYVAFRGSCAMVAALRSGDVLVSVRGASSAAPEWREWTTLTYERGAIRIKTPSPMDRQSAASVQVLAKENGAFTTRVLHAPPDWAFYRQARGFVRALAGAESLRAPVAECVRDVRVMQQMIEMAEVDPVDPAASTRRS